MTVVQLLIIPHVHFLFISRLFTFDSRALSLSWEAYQINFINNGRDALK